ncbi:unnamed protein product [Rhizoctonia solani]|uniref:DUF6533 domain-containing protein n=1 Tax=Rhizoctonia solani TaxID=456999 RepID=A0A8H3HEC3_9AGAM|nr:unnamed protein product [Rhizoctonia solani]
MSSRAGKEVIDVVELYRSIEIAKYMSLASCAFLVCEIFATLPGEINYVWGSRWSFGRYMFHANRIWGPLMLAAYTPTIFLYNLSDQAIVASVLIARIWAIYEMKIWVLIAVCGGCVALSIPSIVFLQLAVNVANLLENPAPDIIAGCPTKRDSLAFVPYLPPFLGETILFALTVYKPLKINRTQVSTPFMTQLIRSGTQYYAIVLLALLSIVLGTLFKITNHAVNNSGLLAAVWSSMCTRIILSGRSWHHKSDLTHDSVEMTVLPTAGWQRREAGGLESISSRSLL